MDLFKARQRAQKEHDDMLEAVGLTEEEAERKAARRGLNRALFYPAHVVAGTAANMVASLGGMTKRARVRAKFARPAQQRRETPATSAPRVEAPGVAVKPKIAFNSGALKLTPIQTAAAAGAKERTRNSL